jgi:hypothetical protein
MTIFTPADHLHRLAKRAMDSGAAVSLEAAETALRSYRLVIDFAPDGASEATAQAALLTALALGKRVFLGGVSVSGALDVPLRSPVGRDNTVRDAVRDLGATVEPAPPATPTVCVGRGKRQKSPSFAIRTVYSGWRGGIVPAHADMPFSLNEPAMPLAAMLAAAMAVNEAFLHIGDNSLVAGRRAVGLSLWDPTADWLAPTSEPPLRFLPTRLWLIGLGHLGQAYLWGLGLLPYAAPSQLHLLLQDTDLVTPSTESTSIVTDNSMIDRRKTRTTAAWAEERGFRTTLTERPFNARTVRESDEPSVALCGVDNAAVRRALDTAGFDLVVEAGLGRGHRDFRSILVHTLPADLPSGKLWPEDVAKPSSIERAPAYRKLLEEQSLDQCGVTLLAGKAVGAPFVGAVAATLVISEVLRLLHGGPLHKLIDLNLVDPAYRRVVANSRDFGSINPGFVEV